MQQPQREPPLPAESFAQTGPEASLDLFDDAIPTADYEAMRIRSEDDLFSDDFTPASEPVVERTVAAHPLPASTTGTATGINPAARGRGDGGRGRRGRGRGRGRGGLGRRDEEDATPPSTAALSATESRGEDAATPATPPQPESTASTPSAQPPIVKPTISSQTPPVKPTPSVRGDRHATGGLPKPKLTESELAEKMATIRIKNAALHAAHARAEADAASFAAREERASRRTAEERAQRQRLEGERERNRERKLKARGGREWDVGKEESGWGEMSGGRKRGDEAGDGREYMYREPRRGSGTERSRGGRGRGGVGEQNGRVPRQEDFPMLPPPSSKKKMTGGTVEAKGSWADQMESTAS